MFSFVALAWNTSDTTAVAAAKFLTERLYATGRNWCSTINAPGLAVFHTDEWPGEWSAYRLAGGAGVVFGSIYRRVADEYDVSTDVVFDHAESSAIVKSAARHLLERYWGSYVAVIHNAHTRESWVLRDPQGGLPCNVTKFEGVTIFFSDVEDCVALRALKFSINWDYIRAYVCNASHSARATGLNEVAEAVPGESIRIGPDGRNGTTLLWDPVRIAQTNVIESLDEAIASIRSTTRMCVWTRVANHKSVLHRLSGGFDSTVVLACLSSAPNKPRITNYNSFDRFSLEDDERKWARLGASHFRCDLIEREREVSNIRLEDVMKTKRRVRPINYHSALQDPLLKQRIATERQATAVFSGVAGDQVYYNGVKKLIPIDYLCRRGPRPGFFSMCMEVARADQETIWSVLYQSARTAIAPPRWSSADEYFQYLQIVSEETMERVKRDAGAVHPWLQDASGLPPGKHLHVQSMIQSMNPYHPLGLREGYVERAPLLEQPLVELCLRTPIDVLSRVQQDRFAARQAFAQDIPPQILTRYSKGGVTAYLGRLLEKERGFLRDFMLGGILVENGLLKREVLEAALAPNRSPTITVAAELLYEHFNTEASLKRWADIAPVRAA